MGETASRWSERLPGIALLLARLYVGQYFLQSGLAKVVRGFLWGGALLPQLERFASGTPHLWYKAWLVNVVIPQEQLFAILTSLGESLAGIGLILGAYTRFAAAGGIFMVANYLFSKGWPNPAASHDKDFIVLLLVILIGNAGNYWGIDGWRRRR
jgi:thiosulfate dehydrogenase (quinone) large subunit